jgi:hypothetical protein
MIGLATRIVFPFSLVPVAMRNKMHKAKLECVWTGLLTTLQLGACMSFSRFVWPAEIFGYYVTAATIAVTTVGPRHLCRQGISSLVLPNKLGCPPIRVSFTISPNRG